MASKSPLPSRHGRNTSKYSLPRPSSFLLALQETVAFYRGLIFFVFQNGSYNQCKHIFKGNTEAKVYVFSLATMFFLWDKPHYRNPTFQVDLLKNLRNVAVPGTGVPLSVFAQNKVLAYLFVFFLLPFIAFVGAIMVALKYFLVTAQQDRPVSVKEALRITVFTTNFWSQVCGNYISNLLMPEDWFNFWQINCRLSSYHEYLTKCPQYKLENKWEFLVDCREKGVAGSPVLDIPELVIKDRNEEGGMGIFMFKNALNGGDWIIQKRLQNSEQIAKLLPSTAPLSTFRVLTGSTAWLDGKDATLAKSIKLMTCVFRAGLSNALTDHKSVLFRFDSSTGSFGRGTSSSHWYELGPFVFLKYLRLALYDLITKDMSVLKNLVSEHGLVDHPETGVSITRESLDKKLADEMVRITSEAHFELMRYVPFVGWDVAVTTDGVFLLEANLSCNFFRGSFDRMWYFATLDRFFTRFDKK